MEKKATLSEAFADTGNYLYSKLYNVFSGKKSDDSTDTFDGISLVESYDTEAQSIENISDYYKLITKISAISKSLTEISQTIISKDWTIRSKASEKEIEKTPPDMQLIIEQPYRHYSYNEFISLLTIDLLIAGNVFIYIVKDNELKRAALRRIDPQYVEIENGRWTENRDGKAEPLDEKYLIHVKYLPDPANPRWGKGVIANNITLFTNIMRMLEFRENFYKNGCFPAGVFAVENQGAVNEPKLKADIKTKYKGAKNAGEPMVLTGKLTYHQIQLDPSVLKLSDELVLLYKEVMIAFGMPRYLMELGLRDTGQKYNNHAKQQEHYIKTTIIPVAKKIEAVFNSVAQRFNPDYEFKFKISSEVYSDETLQSLVDSGTSTPKEHRELLNLPELEDTEGILDKHYMQAGRTTMDSVADGSNIPEPAPPVVPGIPAEDELPVKPEDKNPPKKKVPNAKPRGKSWRDNHYLSEPEGETWAIDEVKRDINVNRIRKDFDSLNRKTQKKKTKEFIRKFESYLVEQYMAFMTAMKSHEAELENLTKPEKADKDVKQYIGKIYKQADEAAKISVIGATLYQSVGSATFSNTENILTIGVAFLMTDPGVAAKVNLLRETTVKVATSTLSQIEEVVRRGIENGSTSAEVAKDMWRHFVDEDKVLPDKFTVSNVSGRRLNDRAVTIARNEVNRANRLFSIESMKQSGVVRSLAVIGGSNPCDLCTPYFGQNFPFEMADELSNIHVNCECTLVPGEIVTE